MSLGRSPFGTTPWGGAALESGGISLVFANPAVNATTVPITSSVEFHLNAPAEFDELTLTVSFNGTTVIRNGEFVAPYNGTVFVEADVLRVVVSTHPAFPDGNPITVGINVLDLSGAVGNLSYVFNTGDAVLSGSETVTLTELLRIGYVTDLSETLTLTEGMSPFVATTVETLTLTEELSLQQEFAPPINIVLSLFEGFQAGTLTFLSVDGTTLVVGFPEEMSLDDVVDLENYRFSALDAGAFPFTPVAAVPVQDTHQSGTQGQVVGLGSSSFQFDTVTGNFTPLNVGDYLYITGSPNPTKFSFNASEAYRIISFSGSTITVDRPLPLHDSSNGTFVPGVGYTAGTGQLHWTHKSGAKGVTLKTTEATRLKNYRGFVSGVKRKLSGLIFSGAADFEANGRRPRVSSVQFVPEDGSVIVSFDETMRIDPELVSTAEYTISGPSTVNIIDVRAIDSQTVVLKTAGFGAGIYTLTVNALATPKDEAGNPLDPLFNEAIFAASVPLLTRSIFTDKGPIAKPALTLQSGSGGTIQTQATSFFGTVTLNEVVLTGGAFTSTHVGLYIELGGSTVNAGTYKVAGVISATRLKLEANLRLPDPSNGSLTWRLYDPRTGEIADDPSDVVVRVNGVVTAVQAVIGLLGQIVLPSAPGADDDVKVDYSWIPEPTVEIRRLNSREFRLNNWGTNSGNVGASQHTYRYRNTLVAPSTFEPEDLLAEQTQPLLRDLHYRAFERAYSVALNDPNLLVLNSPFHKIAYPSLIRQVSESSVTYSGNVLPESDPISPWQRKGIGVSTLSNGSLIVEDNTAGPFPTGNPLFWTRGVDLTFPHVFALTWRMRVDSTTPAGVFTGVSVGWSNDKRALVVGFLLDGGVRKIGFLKKGFGNDPTSSLAWTGGLDGNGDPTGLPFNFDWSVLHSYRLFRDRDGVIRLFVDGEVVENLLITEEELPFLEELNEPFTEVQNAFFGALSRQAESVSTWDFVRFIVLPTNPQETAPSVFVSYESDTAPETASSPWTPVGYHGTTSILGSTLILDSTSATDEATAESVGLIGGDFRGYTRIEPLLSVSSDVIFDVAPQIRTLTHGVTPNAVMAAIDDGSRLVQLCFFPSLQQPKVSYPGRTMPQDATPRPWLSLGSSTATMLGRTLRIEDTTTMDGRVFAIEDLEPMGGPNRIIETSIDYFVEARFKVISYVPDGTATNFCGATFDAFDGTRTVGLLLRETGAGVLQVAFHSDGTLLGAGSQFDFNWNDGQAHTYRLAKSTTGNLVSLFIDNVLIGTFAYSSFDVAVGNPTVSFGSSTSASSGSRSVVDWIYVNAWRAQPTTGVKKYVGLWKGTDEGNLTDFHLPLKTSGRAQVVGNVLTNTQTNFVAAGVTVGDEVVVDIGPNKGVYEVASVNPTVLTITTSFPLGPTEAPYRIPSQIDWTVAHKYRVVRDPGGSVAVILDSNSVPIIRVDFDEINIPPSTVGLPFRINRGLPSVTWGAFDPTNLSQTAWSFVRYGITRSPTELRIAPHHQVLNQRNIMSSPEHLFSSIPHNHTQFSSSSTGIPYPWREFVENTGLTAFTRLNEGTPLVPSTQTYEVRRPTPSLQFISTLNNPEDVLNNDGDFLLNDGATQVELIVPDDVLYNCLEIVEKTTGETDHIAPMDDGGFVAIRKLSWQKEVCGTLSGDQLPENDPNFGTPWVLQSENPGDVSTTSFGGIITYGVGAGGENTIYRNATPLTDPVGLDTTVTFRLKLLSDSTLGTGDTGVRFGFSAFGLTAALAFVTTPGGDKEVHLLDLNANSILGALLFDFDDGAYHTYRLVKNVGDGTIDFTIDP